ncbi:MAG: FAD-dependent oxidoreductase [Clostridiales bacterium]|nr:FAD-dependent oxidoreductase [Clostridiales bacterium]
MTQYPHLFSPFMVGKHLFKNRILAAPIGAWVFSPDNYIFDYAIDMFAEKALGGAASVTAGHTEINYHEPDEDGFGLYFDLRGRNGSAALSEFSRAVTSRGAHVSIELNYGGLYAGAKNRLCYGPSAYVEKDDTVIHEMTEEKIAQTIRQYADCAARMQRCGFDMVTIHAAHGWLPEQFLSEKTNHRTDRFGGSLENRMRFSLMLLDEVRAAVGPDFMIEYRMGGVDPALHPAEFEELLAFVHAIEDKIDLLHLSTGLDANSKERTIPTYFWPRAINLPYAKALKDHGVKVPIAIVGAISDPETAGRVIAEGIADSVAMGRSLIADPQFPRKARCGQAEDITPCIGCMNCLSNMHKTHTVVCSVNPRTGREHRLASSVPSASGKKVVILGGGPAGMEAVITAADRGCKVVLIEKNPELGGLLNVSEEDPTKYLLHGFRDYLVHQTMKRGIEVRLNTEADRSMIESEQADALIVAVGATPVIPDLPGKDDIHVITAEEAYRNPDAVGQRVVVVGGNMVGCELALFFNQAGREVTLVEMSDRIHADANDPVGEAIDARLQGATVLNEAKCTDLTPQNVCYIQDGEEHTVTADTVVIAVGMQPKLDVFFEMQDAAEQVIPVGYCVRVSNVRGAVHTGYYAALDI